jgi:hypothetical protein
MHDEDEALTASRSLSRFSALRKTALQLRTLSPVPLSCKAIDAKAVRLGYLLDKKLDAEKASITAQFSGRDTFDSDTRKLLSDVAYDYHKKAMNLKYEMDEDLEKQMNSTTPGKVYVKG